MPNGNSDSLEVDVDPVWAGPSQHLGETGRAAIDCRIKAEVALNIAALFQPVGNSDGARASQLGELTDQ